MKFGMRLLGGLCGTLGMGLVCVACGGGGTPEGDDNGSGGTGGGSGGSTTLPTGGCGDGILDVGEICDDGNTKDDAACSADCTSNKMCPDGVFDGNLAPKNEAELLVASGCSTIDGFLSLSSYPGKDLAPLAALKKVTFDLSIDETSLTSLSGLENLTEIGGDLEIGWNGALASLAGLEALATVGGRIDLNDTSVTSLAPLANVTSVHDVWLMDNDQLTTLGGAFANITNLKGDITITTNHALLDLDAFANLETMDGALWLHWNSGVVSFKGFGKLKEVCVAPNTSLTCAHISGYYSLTDSNVLPSLTTVHGYAQLELNIDAPFPKLKNVTGGFRVGDSDLEVLSGFNALETVGGEFILGNNVNITKVTGLTKLTSTGGLNLSWMPLLTEFTGLSALTTVTGDVVISELTDLTNFGNLSALTTVGGDLTIKENTLLTNLSFLDLVNDVPGALTITDNPALPECQATAFSSKVTPGGTVTISGNGSGSCP